MIPCKIRVVSDLQLAINPWKDVYIISIRRLSEGFDWMVWEDLVEGT